MSNERETHTRHRLARILGLPDSASRDELLAASARLLGALRRRRERLRAQPGEGPEADRTEEPEGALADEIAELTADVERWTGTGSKRIERAARIDRRSLAGALAGTAFMLVLLIAYASGLRIVWQEGSGFAATLEEPAQLILMGRLPGAMLSVFDSDRDELFVRTPAEGAVVELATGRYALEVSREDCPDRWTRSVYFESGATHRFEPFLCIGEGRLTVRSNVTRDRLVIDGFDVGETGAEPHTLSVGDHSVRVEKRGYVPFESSVRIRPETDLEIRAELVTEQKRGHGVKRDRPVAFESPILGSRELLEPEPFDLGNLKQEIAPEKAGLPRTRLLQREGSGGLPDGGSTAWHDRVSRELLTRFDLDGSGQIDQLAESEAISCAFWIEIEQDFDRGGLGLSMARYFGFDGSEWHPNALGFARSMRSAAYAKMKECGLQS